MELKEIYEIADGVAPFALSKEYCGKYGAHDNSGIQLDCGEAIDCVLFALDLTAVAIEQAKRAGAQLIVTHHPPLYRPLSSLQPQGEGSGVLACARAGISVLSAHLNLDCAAGGIDEQLMRMLGGEEVLSVMHPLSDGGYGRVYEVPQQRLCDVQNRLLREGRAKNMRAYGERAVRRIASFCGAGCDEESISFALSHGADTFVSSDEKHHHVVELTERGVNGLFLTHYASEAYGFFAFANNIKNKLEGVRTVLCADGRLL